MHHFPGKKTWMAAKAVEPLLLCGAAYWNNM
jgi:hypothetical protein